MGNRCPYPRLEYLPFVTPPPGDGEPLPLDPRLELLPGPERPAVYLEDPPHDGSFH